MSFTEITRIIVQTEGQAKTGNKVLGDSRYFLIIISPFLQAKTPTTAVQVSFCVPQTEVMNRINSICLAKHQTSWSGKQILSTSDLHLKKIYKKENYICAPLNEVFSLLTNKYKTLNI